MRFEDLTFRPMQDELHGPGELQARCKVAGHEISIRRGGKYLLADADRPYEVLTPKHGLGYMTSGDIDDLFAHLEAGNDTGSFVRKSVASICSD